VRGQGARHICSAKGRRHICAIPSGSPHNIQFPNLCSMGRGHRACTRGRCNVRHNRNSAIQAGSPNNIQPSSLCSKGRFLRVCMWQTAPRPTCSTRARGWAQPRELVQLSCKYNATCHYHHRAIRPGCPHNTRLLNPCSMDRHIWGCKWQIAFWPLCSAKATTLTAYWKTFGWWETRAHAPRCHAGEGLGRRLFQRRIFEAGPCFPHQVRPSIPGPLRNKRPQRRCERRLARE